MNNISKSGLKAQNVSFKGHSKKLDNYGLETHRFYYMYDSKKYDCELELYEISKDMGMNIQVSEKPVKTYSLKDAPFVDISQTEIGEISPELGFAYRFKLTDSNTKQESYGFDNGQVVGIFDGNQGKQFNVVLNNRALINKNGPMQLIMPDEYYPGVSQGVDGSLYVADNLRTKARNAVRNHANRLGGKFLGIIKRLQDGALKNEGVKRIVGTPFTKDSVSSHLYWTENAFQVAPALGNEEDFKQLQVELFKNGINWIADAALVNEGFGGIHMSEMLRKGQSSTCKDMFRVESDVISLGILPKEASEKGYTSMKLINTPFSVDKDGQYSLLNPDYDPTKPTYIQFYDNRLASDAQKVSGTCNDTRTDALKRKSPEPPFDLTTYDKTNTDNIYDITRHYDAVYPFYIEVNPSQLQRNVAAVYEEEGKVDLSNVRIIKALSNFPNFRVENKSKAGDLEFWDGNVDIAKLNFFRCTKDDKRFSDLLPEQREQAIRDFENGTLAVREYAVNMGRHWTKLTADTQLEYASKVIGQSAAKTPQEYMSAIKAGVKAGNLPPETMQEVNEEVINNVLNGDYYLPRIDAIDARNDINPENGYNDYLASDYILKKAMEVQFETLPVSTNILGILTSPYIQKKPYTEDEIGVSRYDIYKAGNPNLPDKYSDVYGESDELYTKTILPIAENILSSVPGIKNEDGKVSEYGRYVISEAMPDIVRFILTKALNNSANIQIKKDGTLDFTKVDSSAITMQSLGIPFDTLSSEDEAKELLKSIKKGIKTSMTKGEYDKLADALKIRFKGRTLDDFRIAEMIMDRTESGLGWRIDATKDVASMDAVRTGSDTMASAWEDTTSIWKKFNQAVLNVNPHAYTTAEITDLDQLFQGQFPSIFKNDADAERKFLQETGITAVANYNYFFSLLPELFSKSTIEKGEPSWSAMQSRNNDLMSKLDEGWESDRERNPGFLFQSAEDGVVNSYTFIGNHDKPRALHGLALDMNLFHYGALSKTEENRLMAAYKTDSAYATKLKLLANFVNKAKMAALILNKDVDAVNFHSILESTGDGEAAVKTAIENASLKLDPEVKELMEKEDFSQLSSEAFAMGVRINQALNAVVTDNKLKTEINNAIVDLALGNYKGSSFAPLAFGTRTFETAIKSVLDQYEYKTGSKVPNRAKIESDILENMLTPAFDRFLSIYKLLVTLPGSPTDFAGDRVGLTGYETKCKNDYQQNRNIINWEWLNKTKEDGSVNEEYRPYIATFYDAMNQIAMLRSEPKLSALNTGSTITVPPYVKLDKDGNPEFDQKLQSIIRYNDEGSVVIAVMDSTGSNANNSERMKKGRELGTKLYLGNTDGTKRGLKFGLQEGMVFKNPLDTNGAIYTVKKEGDSYYLEKTLSGVVQPINIEEKDNNTLLLYKD